MTTNNLESVYFLLVDDLDENLLALEALLRREGLVLLKAKSGAEALELLLQHEVALALLDVQMPEMSGFELAELMRGTERTRSVPIIFLTAGSADQQRRFRGYEAGAIDFLQKPIEPDILKSKAAVFFELYRRRQEVARYATSLEEADRYKDAFLAMLAHELRNPLAPLRNGLEVLSKTPGEDMARDVLAMLKRQVSHMSRLIDDLLDISRIRSGKIELRLDDASIQCVVETALDLSRPMMETAQHQLTVHMPETPIRLNMDVTRIAQAVGNLLNNAAKYTADQGEISLDIRLDGDILVIIVADNGIGIPADKLEHIFELFMQIEDAQTYSQGGLGIGLALVRRIIDMHGGSITAESGGLRKGSTFTMRLPGARVGTAVQTHTAAPPLVEDKQEKSLRILVVDDNIDAAQTVTWMLEMLGHDVIQAHAGESALEKAHDFKPDAILLDIGLPDISGYDVCRQLRQKDAFKNTIIIAQTGWGQKRDRDMAFESGFDHHLVKPASPDDFTRVLKLGRTRA